MLSFLWPGFAVFNSCATLKKKRRGHVREGCHVNRLKQMGYHFCVLNKVSQVCLLLLVVSMCIVICLQPIMCHFSIAVNSAPAVAPETPNQLATDRATLAQEKEDAVQQQDNEDIGIFSVEIFRKERNFFLSRHYFCELLRQTSVETSYISSSGMRSSGCVSWSSHSAESDLSCWQRSPTFFLGPLNSKAYIIPQEKKIHKLECFIECVHMTSRRPCWRSKQRNGGHLGGVQ